ncbi:hypothetical protein BDA96_08G088900 [Sorghum bicolor]|uniref:Uncharacterized protein n=1 Tax=Sorghum bicolor TaxID=4558 RepID=A0A921QHJ8_SORBI|nr:hypothetical protein BDA96_08G088900 [Sorghum bicolor]
MTNFHSGSDLPLRIAGCLACVKGLITSNTQILYLRHQQVLWDHADVSTSLVQMHLILFIVPSYGIC